MLLAEEKVIFNLGIIQLSLDHDTKEYDSITMCDCTGCENACFEFCQDHTSNDYVPR